MVRINQALGRISMTLRCQNRILSNRSEASLHYQQPIKIISAGNNCSPSSRNIQSNLMKQYGPNLFQNKESFKRMERYRLATMQSLKNKWNTKKFKWQDDPNFDLESFKRGTKQAMSVVTQCLVKNENANAYLSTEASIQLQLDSLKWNNFVRLNIGLEPDEIYQILILDIRNQKNNTRNFTNYVIDTLGICYKDKVKTNTYFVRKDYYLEIHLYTRFERKYLFKKYKKNEAQKQEWNITNFFVHKMDIFRVPDND